MKQVLVEFDEETARRLDRAAPARSRRRSEFIRTAVRRALDTVEEARIAAAYGRQPDDEAVNFDPSLWAPPVGRRKGKR